MMSDPFVADGVELTQENARRLVRQHLEDGTVFANRDDLSPSGAVIRILERIADLPIEGAVKAGIFDALRSSQAAIAHEAAVTIATVPIVFTVAELVDAAADLPHAGAAEGGPDARTRVLTAAVEADGDIAPALAALREEVAVPGWGQWVVTTLSAYDPGWVTGHAALVVAGEPERLVDALRRVHDAPSRERILAEAVSAEPALLPHLDDVFSKLDLDTDLVARLNAVVRP
jgi:hypothetical protein